ncbi:PQQ-dependent sugar dehydrogenase [Anaerosacchariphilus polymeriproducens]|uniref:Uncharacterized protein n=1 Tax=Anaerosacchariphilus polymeriproducens TaxID=1812858 RepID=A0A371AVZ1_9FIRM|nr:PQQ-dependent sugar dehydrogenase [Anaerosacchariphilus polymeriproducens]RDU23745.1 hypothetical protein DWV06_07765 [Anaerosacchariphilus polymeriproducens]
MYDENNFILNERLYIQQNEKQARILDPDVISVPWGYQVEVFAQGLNTPVGLDFNEEGDMLIAESGEASGNAQVLLLKNGELEKVAEDFHIPITGINYYDGRIFVSHKGVITVLHEDGMREDIISGLPSNGDFGNNRVEISKNNKMYYGQGTATNSGIVGLDNKWLFEHPFFHDFVGSPVILKGINYKTKNILIPAEEAAYTGAFSAFGVPNTNEYTMEEGRTLATGSIMRANLDGSELEMVAWGLRNPFQVKFDKFDRLIISNQGPDNRGSRPIANGLDELHLFKEGTWYGWPDYVAAEPVTMPRFTPIGAKQPDLLLETVPSVPPSVPPLPIATFPAGANICGFDFNYNEDFGPLGDAYVAQFGSLQFEESKDYIRSGVGHRVVRVNMNTGETSTFAINKTGFPQEEGFGRPIDVVFGPDSAMYIADYSTDIGEFPNVFSPNTGVIWRISKV